MNWMRIRYHACPRFRSRNAIYRVLPAPRLSMYAEMHEGRCVLAAPGCVVTILVPSNGSVEIEYWDPEEETLNFNPMSNADRLDIVRSALAKATEGLEGDEYKSFMEELL